MEENISIMLGAVATVSICIASFLKGRDMRLILLLVFSTNALLGISYILTGAFNGVATSFIGAGMTIVNYFFERKNKPLPVWLISIYAAVLIAVNILVFTRLADILVILTALAFVMGISQKDGKHFRLWTLLNVGLWVVYDAVTFSFGPLTTHSLQLATVIMGIVIHDRKKEA